MPQKCTCISSNVRGVIIIHPIIIWPVGPFETVNVIKGYAKKIDSRLELTNVLHQKHILVPELIFSILLCGQWTWDQKSVLHCGTGTRVLQSGLATDDIVSTAGFGILEEKEKESQSSDM